MHPEMHPMTMHRASAFPLCREIVIGETGFEPATARPPAGAIQTYRVRFRSEAGSVVLSCAYLRSI